MEEPKTKEPFKGGLFRGPESFMIREHGYRQSRLMRTVEPKNTGLLRWKATHLPSQPPSHPPSAQNIKEWTQVK